MTAPGETPAESELARTIERPPRLSFLANWRRNIIYIGFLCIFAIFALTLGNQGFLNPTNLLNIVRQSAMIAVMAVAMTFVLAAGEIDLSVGSLAGFSSVATAMTIRAAGTPAGVAAGLATGVIVGLFNGLITTRVGIPSFLTTLAMMGIATGVSMWMSNTAAIPIIDRTYAFVFGGGSLGPAREGRRLPRSGRPGDEDEPTR